MLTAATTMFYALPVAGNKQRPGVEAREIAANGRSVHAAFLRLAQPIYGRLWAGGRKAYRCYPGLPTRSVAAHPVWKRERQFKRTGDSAMKSSSKTPVVKATASKRMPPWFGYVSPSVSTVKVGAYKNYGARGIKVCERWHAFENFLSDMGEPTPDQSIDRIDVNGDYCPENCRWETKKNQQRNTTRNVMLTMNGKTQCIADWATEYGMKFTTLYMRITRSGMSIDEAVSKPIGRWSK